MLVWLRSGRRRRRGASSLGSGDVGNDRPVLPGAATGQIKPRRETPRQRKSDFPIKEAWPVDRPGQTSREHSPWGFLGRSRLARATSGLTTNESSQIAEKFPGGAVLCGGVLFNMRTPSAGKSSHGMAGSLAWWKASWGEMRESCPGEASWGWMRESCPRDEREMKGGHPARAWESRKVAVPIPRTRSGTGGRWVAGSRTGVIPPSGRASGLAGAGLVGKNCHDFDRTSGRGIDDRRSYMANAGRARVVTCNAMQWDANAVGMRPGRRNTASPAGSQLGRATLCHRQSRPTSARLSGGRRSCTESRSRGGRRHDVLVEFLPTPPLAYGLLSVAYCLLPIAYCLLPIAYCLLPIAYCLLPIADCRLPIHRPSVPAARRECVAGATFGDGGSKKGGDGVLGDPGTRPSPRAQGQSSQGPISSASPLALAPSSSWRVLATFRRIRLARDEVPVPVPVPVRCYSVLLGPPGPPPLSASTRRCASGTLWGKTTIDAGSDRDPSPRTPPYLRYLVHSNGCGAEDDDTIVRGRPSPWSAPMPRPGATPSSPYPVDTYSPHHPIRHGRPAAAKIALQSMLSSPDMSSAESPKDCRREI
ncbi:unnamed protein product [Diplocarpon coronariae]